MDKQDKQKIQKVKVELNRDLANELLKRKKVGDSYSDVIEKLLKQNG